VPSGIVAPVSSSWAAVKRRAFRVFQDAIKGD